jgi:A/G-specific adenine glycosylase
MKEPEKNEKISKAEFFSRELLRWYKENGEAYPWRNEGDAYKVFVSEILLRKTDRNKVKEFYPSFIKLFPNLEELARADINLLVNTLRPLGLSYQRAHQLKEATEFISEKFVGRLPGNLEDLMRIPGVGRYTAGAVLCFAYSKDTAILDTNVIRLVERFFNVTSKRARPRDDPALWKFIKTLIPRGSTREFFYSALDLSNQICRAKKPKCRECPLRLMCSYFEKAGEGL